jgi:hypothetical protein
VIKSARDGNAGAPITVRRNLESYRFQETALMDRNTGNREWSTMFGKIRLRAASLVPLLASLPLAACGTTNDPGGTDSGGSAGSGGTTPTGGSSTGGASTGGVSTGGVSTGGVSTGGVSTGGAGIGGGMTGGISGGGGVATGGALPTGGTGAGTGGDGMGGTGMAGMGAGGASGGAGGAGAGGKGGPGGAGGGPASAEDTGADCGSTAAEQLAANNNSLPDPFAMHAGMRITTKAQWRCRREEIRKDIERYEIGTKPPPPMVAATLSGNTLSVRVTTSAGNITITSTVGMASGTTPHCVAIGMNGNSSLISGCVQVPFMHNQVVTYSQNSTQMQSDPFYKVYPEAWGKVGNYAAWSWGISRIIDGLDQVKTQLNIDMTKIGVHGCSYAGKMALFGGAFDERVALTVAQESGGGGITSWRTSQQFTTRTGINVEKIDNTNFGWFLSSMRTLSPFRLPHDHHELIAMIAPRAVIALGNPEYDWLGDESGYKSVVAAKEVWKALGVEANIGYDFTGNHAHCAAPTSEVNSTNAFVNKFLKGQTATTSIAIQPNRSQFQLSTTEAINWQTPTLQ